MWQSSYIWMITILITSQKKIKNLYISIPWKIKTCDSTKIGHVLCNENKIIKDLMNVF
jgi:hypothetical protein